MGNKVHRVNMGNSNFNKVNKIKIEEKRDREVEEKGRGRSLWTHIFQQFVIPIWC